MTSFVLRIFFSGLIAFVSSPDGKELTVLLLNAEHGYHMSDGSVLEQHVPLLLARAKSCSGDCPKQDIAISKYLFSEKPDAQASDALAQALGGGAAWKLSGSDLSLGKACVADASSRGSVTLQGRSERTASKSPLVIPSTPKERENFDWVPHLTRLCPACGGLRDDVLSAHPPADLIVARLRLHGGRVLTNRLVRVDGDVKPIHFKPLGGGNEVPGAQALATWVEAEIQVPDGVVEVVERSFTNGAKRCMKLSPENGIVEMAILNLPPFLPPSPADNGAAQAPPQVGKHFAMYYELLKTPPTQDQRPVPQLATAGTPEPHRPWPELHPKEDMKSVLLETLRIDAGRGPYDQVICPTSQIP